MAEREWVWPVIAVVVAVVAAVAAVAARGGNGSSAGVSFFAAFIGTTVALYAVLAATTRPTLAAAVFAGIVDVAVLVYWVVVVITALEGVR